MDIKACHKSLASQLLRALNLSFITGMQPTDVQDMICNDTDFVRYTVTGINQKITLLMICIDADKIWNYSGKYMTEKYFKDVKVDIMNVGTEKAIRIQVDNDVLQEVRKNFKETKETGILTGKKKFDAIFAELSNRLACIKRHFFASPFEMMLTAIKNNTQGKGNQTLANLCFYTKPDRKQKVWLAFQKTQISVYYGITFQDRFQQQLGRIYFSELVDSRKHVQNAPSISVSQSQLSEFLIKSFPEQKKQKYTFSNGIVELTISGKTVRNQQGMASRLAAFRNYSYYHIQASKCYLHSRVLRRINHFQRDLNLSKIQEITQ